MSAARALGSEGYVIRRVQEAYRSGSKSAIAQSVTSMMRSSVDLQAVKSAGYGALGAASSKMYKTRKAAKVQAQSMLLDLSTPLRLQFMVAVRDTIKAEATGDPDMCLCISRQIESLIDLLWDDVTVYAETTLADIRDANLGRVETQVAVLSAIGDKPCCCSPRWWRAKFLYHLLPFDKSTFGQAKDPIYWVLMAVSLSSMMGIRVAFFTLQLFLLVLSCPPDEYQLVLYILSFKGAQFISSGVFLAIYAAITYYLCIHEDGTHTCNIDGPGAQEDVIAGAVDIIGSNVLVWVAFLLLPFSAKYAGSRQLVDPDDDQAEVTSRCCGCRYTRGRGGRLAGLLYWDLFSFVLSCAFLVGLVYFNRAHLRRGEIPTTATDQLNKEVQEEFLQKAHLLELRTSIFWARLFYSMLALPFLPFNLPVLSSILTHTRTTGFNPQGVCVPYMLPPVPKPEKKDIELGPAE